MIYYFFDFTDEKSLQPITVINSLIKQLVQLVDPDDLSLELQVALQSTYAKHTTAKQGFELDTRTEHIRKLCCLFRRVFVVIDGLDECARNDRRSLLNMFRTFLNGFYGNQDGILKLLLASRPEIDIKEQLDKFDLYTIALSEQIEHHGVDMDFYIRSRLEPHFQDLSLLPSHEELLADIVVKILEESKGMYILSSFGSV